MPLCLSFLWNKITTSKMILVYAGLQTFWCCLELSTPAALRHINTSSNGQRSSHRSALYPTKVLSTWLHLQNQQKQYFLLQAREVKLPARSAIVIIPILGAFFQAFSVCQLSVTELEIFCVGCLPLADFFGCFNQNNSWFYQTGITESYNLFKNSF